MENVGSSVFPDVYKYRKMEKEVAEDEENEIIEKYKI